MTAIIEQNTSPRGWYFYSGIAEKILAAHEKGDDRVSLSLDLNISQRIFQIRDGCLLLHGTRASGAEQEETAAALEISALARVAGDPDKIFLYDGRDLAPIEVRADGYYKLVPTNSVPTLEINGIKMHRSKDIDPIEDAGLKTRAVVRPGDIVLDTCGGLGYSAVFAVKAGAQKVVSFEKSRAVMKIRAQNPWTRPELWPQAGPETVDWLAPEAFGRIDLSLGDSVEQIKEMADQSFDAVIHDPPRFCSATGDLYGRSFYGHLARVMRDRGRLFHYTGSPKRIKNGNRFVANAAKRLEAAGFTKVVFNDRLQGLLAEKARGWPG